VYANVRDESTVPFKCSPSLRTQSVIRPEHRTYVVVVVRLTDEL